MIRITCPHCFYANYIAADLLIFSNSSPLLYYIAADLLNFSNTLSAWPSLPPPKSLTSWRHCGLSGAEAKVVPRQVFTAETFRGRGSISGFRLQRHPQAGGFPSRASPCWGDVADEFQQHAVDDEVGLKVERLVGLADRESDQVQKRRSA